MSNEIFISLKPEFIELIKERKKTHEFRSYRPKKDISRLWIYITVPVASLKYVVDVGRIVEYPEKIKVGGVNNLEFNKGLKKSKYAFPIKHLYELVEPISLERLKKEFGFVPPQSFIYIDKYPSLIDYVIKKGFKRLF